MTADALTATTARDQDRALTARAALVVPGGMQPTYDRLPDCAVGAPTTAPPCWHRGAVARLKECILAEMQNDVIKEV